MDHGRIEWMHLVDVAGGEPRAVESATLIAGFGLDGDRGVAAARAAGAAAVAPESQLTLIAAEAIEAAAEHLGHPLPPGITRRNLTVRGVDLDAGVGRRLRIGGALVRGIEPCDPCGYLERVSGIPGITRALVDRGGLRCEVLEGAELRIGDLVVLLAD
jgi:MOSC domain-containing protein YiiM